MSLGQSHAHDYHFAVQICYIFQYYRFACIGIYIIYTYKIMPYDETIMADPLSNQQQNT